MLKRIILIINVFVLYFIFNTSIVKAEAIEVSNFNELNTAITNGSSEISIIDNFEFDNSLTISSNVVINGNGKKITRQSGYKGVLFNINSTGTLEINELTIDSGASGWKMDYDNAYYTQADNKGYRRVPTINGENDTIATNSLITNQGNFILNNSTLQNGRSTVTGTAIKGAGNNKINNSTIKHFGSSTNGGALYITGGKLEIINSTFKENSTGVGNTASLQGGAVYITGASSIEIKDNSLFEDNFAQNNGGALYILKTSILIQDTIFRHNLSGNDGCVISMQSTVNGKSSVMEDTIFENNIGLARTSQSMGCVWLQQWNSTKEEPIIFKNLIFRNNDLSTGAAISDAAKNTYAKLENIELYNNSVNSGGLLYAQSSMYEIKNVSIHDNSVKQGSAIYLAGVSVITIEDSEIKNNVGTSSGTGICMIAGEVEMKNCEISGNTSDVRGAGIFVKGHYEGYDPVLKIENSIIKDNISLKDGGGICVSDEANIYSTIIIDDKTKIYDNKSETCGDDFVYVREDNTENTSDKIIKLDNISIAGITGIDGWYHDNEDNRFADADNPEKFQDYTSYKGGAIYLKAAGISTYDYDLNGGTADDVKPITVKYGQDYIVEDEIPKKDGYEFEGWNTKADGSGIWLKPGDKYDGSEGYVLYAHYKKIEEKIDTDDSKEIKKEENKKTDDENNIEEKEDNEIKNPKTGDNIYIWNGVIIISLLMESVLIINKKRRNKHYEK